MASSAFLDQYEALDIIGNGSFGIIRKVRRKTDGVVRPAMSEGSSQMLIFITNRFLLERNLTLSE